MPTDTRSKKMENLSSNDKLDLIISQNTTISGDIANINMKIDALTLSFNKLEQDVVNNTNQISINAEKIDALEQYTRRNNLRLHGIPENPNENTDCIVVDFISNKLGITISLDEIERTHRVGQKRTAHPRAIIIKFGSYRKRSEVFYAKKALKGTGLLITEDLTKQRQSLFAEKKQQVGNKNTWTRDGKVFWVENGKTLSYPKFLNKK